MGEEGGGPQVMVAHRGATEETLQIYRDGHFPMDPQISTAARAIITRRTIHLRDMADTDGYRQGNPNLVSLVDRQGIRTNLLVPLISKGRGIGCLILFRDEVRPYSDDQIALVETFAAQAVIAIENVRQFRELQSRLEREAATREILQVISRSRDDEAPVFDVINETAMRLCRATESIIWTIDGDRFVVGSVCGADPELPRIFAENPIPLNASSAAGRAVLKRALVHIEDLHADPEIRDLPVSRRLQSRTLLAVPLLSADGNPVGVITIFRREVRPFEPQQIDLVQTYATYATIAIENVRQFKALESRTEEVQALNASLEFRVEEQVGEIERMSRLKRFLPAAVADTVVSTGSEKLLKSHRALLGILFCDIRGFTAFCETAEPEETIEVLQNYHEEMGKLIVAHGAGVDHRMGDGIMVLFNDPVPCDDPAGEAVRLAIAMRERMAALCLGWKKLGHRMGFGVGISFGYATVGMVGYEGRYDYTASGTAVNLAARLCDHAKDGEILLSPRAFTAVEDEVICEPGGTLELKGLAAPVEVMNAVAFR
jgi:class 3 adenylate cyclase